MSRYDGILCYECLECDKVWEPSDDLGATQHTLETNHFIHIVRDEES